MMSYRNIARLIAPLGVAFALVLAGTVPAFADWGDSTYAVWRDISATMVGQSPHGDYATSTQKCKVCHAVHSADPNGEVLLRSTVTDACSYCHVVAKVSDYVVYDGIEANYKGTDFQNAHNTGYIGAANNGCVDCHSVHAAYSQMTANEDLTEKILKGARVYEWWDPKYDDNAGAPEPRAIDDKPTALSKWCTSCHMGGTYNYYATSYYAGMTTHVMKDPELYGVGGVNVRGSIVATDVAYASSKHCSSCHTSQYGQAGSHAWPHYTSGARFLVSAGSSVAATSGTAIGQTKYDGVCLRCHRDGSRGVGLTW